MIGLIVVPWLVIRLARHVGQRVKSVFRMQSDFIHRSVARQRGDDPRFVTTIEAERLPPDPPLSDPNEVLTGSSPATAPTAALRSEMLVRWSVRDALYRAQQALDGIDIGELRFSANLASDNNVSFNSAINASWPS